MIYSFFFCSFCFVSFPSSFVLVVMLCCRYSFAFVVVCFVLLFRCFVLSVCVYLLYAVLLVVLLFCRVVALLCMC